ncbi:hypothetical protein GMB51_13405 [Turicibacter sanguinis]|uniref:hypothetical protein n=1 Tax=Turicibacter sanguinis TaxID=154288 RepID=UPI0012BCD2C5|nr:hypothetical protein [Turicibacter sanguinis]MCU7202456.1 hypothetical protein [Turicibacter sanguinis]MDB8565076.1 hypothetical protein [Turicibacter sanguinis]MTN46149.1 hypothetical protein [Turicibacter sanguinis]MTN51993.1 hypothetical protein [Turicibacter sanguinis]MTN55049.1 hypothetical protein [Turicibacter sanguinis]
MLKKIMIMMLLFIVAGCQRQENLQETPIHTSIQLFSTLTGNLVQTDDESYKEYVELFHDLFKEKATYEKFLGLKNMTGPTGVSYSNFVMMQLDNGEMILVSFVPWPEEDRYEIYDIYLVPDSVKYYFEDIQN